MGQPDRAEMARRLRSLHVPGDPVVLPNAWDVTSALVFEREGFPAIATSSSAVASSLGYDDGELTPADEMFAAVERIVRAVAVPVTADVERGYGLVPEELVGRLVDAGAAGCNLEDSQPRSGELVDAATQAEWLSAVNDAALATGVPLVVNARIDIHLREWGDPAGRMPAAVARGRAYLEAGAACVYPIGLTSLDEITEFARAVEGPVNALFRPEGPSLRDLAGAGVARVTFGGGLHLAMRHLLKRAAARVRAGDDPYAGL
jgi:2-methylisocitrate lyase-like PEP mutase family enzyme